MFNYRTLDVDNVEFVPIGTLDELEVEKRLFVSIDDLNIVVFRIAETLFAIGDVCSHDDGPVGDGELDGYVITCPRHGAQFDVRSGKVLSMPAVVDIPAYPVRVVDGQIEVGVPLNP